MRLIAARIVFKSDRDDVRYGTRRVERSFDRAAIPGAVSWGVPVVVFIEDSTRVRSQRMGLCVEAAD